MCPQSLLQNSLPATSTTSSFHEQRIDFARRGASLLYSLGAERVWLFGSLATRRPQDRRSDIDFAVDGLPPHLLKQAIAALGQQFRCRVDVIDLRTAPADLRPAIMRARILLPPDGQGEPPSLPRRRSENRAPGDASAPADPAKRLFTQRLEAVVSALKDAGAKRVIDLGCGKGWLLEALARAGGFDELVGVDQSQEALDIAQERLRTVLDRAQANRITLFQGLLTHRDPRLRGFDAGVAMEVIEHLDPPRLAAFEFVLFEFSRPLTVIITTPNAEYNIKLRLPAGGQFRHREHRFEMTREQFRTHMSNLATRTRYAARFAPIGPIDASVGAPTQMATFKRQG
jgi:SAM-dependent methyltransferase